ncbi:MAG: HAD family hydrolase [Thaumarchaeota archaeon]|jgi:HAD superfamily hydrolase (TIGR01549 family)|nr:HAD family hydrolase [Candidatus Geocrenenecus arthurdayi]MCL7390534.1 HAD family hydrolase [Candidatus Geocrenenecus arthurdayi]MCL7396530.1 HAD family hydrolase [Candidatus Geocrenenecus arthurdayi]MCL7403266.1 HAD family hydrolase [Candidatus Geocrenenecus arthurdayi]
MVIKAVIFDLDGTLLVHKLKLHEAKKEFLNRLRERLHGSIESSIDFPIAYILNELSEEDRITAFKILNEVFEPFEMMAAEVAELREDVKETLEFLKSRDVKLAIATNNSRKSVELCLKNTMIDTYFDVIVTRDDVFDLKPNGKMILKTIENLGVKVDEAIHVGDTIYDVIAAHKVGVKSIAITGGAHSRELLLSSNPDYLINSFKEIFQIVNL